MAKQKRHVVLKAKKPGQCAWCSGSLRGEYFTVTFPEKGQATFHIECLYRYREVMKR
jgi:hypothetical protein